MTQSVHQRIADELGVAERQVRAAVELLDGGATVPFIARYRKEATGLLDDTQLRTLEERLRYLRELDERRAAVLESIRGQGKLDEALEAQIMAADSKSRLEDIYLPYKPKRRTRAQIAREAGLEPLAETLLADPSQDPRATAAGFVDAEKGVADAAAALEGARAILVETLRRGRRPDRHAARADVVAGPAGFPGTRGPGGRPAPSSPTTSTSPSRTPKLPSHRILAMFRGEKEGVLDLTMEPEEAGEADAAPTGPTRYEAAIAGRFGVSDAGRPADRWLADTVRWAWRTRILIHLGADLRMRLWQAAEEEAVRVFATNLRDLLLAAPAGTRPTMGLDPGLRTGVKVAVVDATGKVRRHRHDLPARAAPAVGRVGGDPRPAGRRARGGADRDRQRHRLPGDRQARRRADQRGTRSSNLTKVMVSEAGASVYSASAYASQELPGMDVSLRGAVSIARRLQDPLAELVKIDPKSIGVGQYQHDLSEVKLSRSLDAVVEDCVNAVGVDVNTASAPLLTRVSGHRRRRWPRTSSLHRDANGPFRSRTELKRCRGSARRRSSSAPASCASPTATTRWTPPACTPRRTRWCAASWPPPAATCATLIGNERRPARAEGRPTSSTTRSACRPSPTSSPSWRSRAGTRARRSAPPPSPRASRRSPT